MVIAYDADAVTKELVRIARSALAAHLRGRNALVGFLDWDVFRGQGIDNHLSAVGPEVVLDEIAHVDFTGSAWKKDSLRLKPHMNTTEGRILPVLTMLEGRSCLPPRHHNLPGATATLTDRERKRVRGAVFA